MQERSEIYGFEPKPKRLGRLQLTEIYYIDCPNWLWKA